MTSNTINVQNGDNTPSTTAQILIENKIDYTPKVSVIIPVYNVEKYLKECLDSVVNQTLKEIEIICVDDGSTDSSLDILKEYASKDSRFTIITQENSGAGQARNNGIDIARGEYIAFVDSDDLYPKNDTLENMYNSAIKHKVLICGGSLNQIKMDKIITDPSLFEEGYAFKKDGIVEYNNYQFDYGYWRFIYKREFLKENHLYFPNYLRYQDPPFFVKSMIKAKKFYALKQPTYVYRVSYKDITWNNRKIIDLFNGFSDVLDISLQHNLVKLYEKTVSRILSPYILKSIEKFILEDENVKNKIVNTVKNINYNILKNKKLKLPKHLKYDSLISVIISVYNGEEYLAECLDSAINQTLKNIEIICVNDGSTDNSLKILEEYAKKDNRITIINQENQGLSISRNNAINIANGQYLVFLDADDYLRIDALEIIYNQMDKKNLDMLSYSGLNFDNITRKMEIYQYWEYTYLPINFKYNKYNYKKCKSFMHKLNVSSCLTSYKKELIEDNNITFPPHLCYEDNVFYLKALTKAKRCGIIRDKLYFRRVHEASITQNRNKHFSDQIKISDLVIEYISNFNKKIYNNYKKEYISSCVNIYNSFNFDDKEKYQEELKNLLIKHNVKFKITNNNKIKIKKKQNKLLKFITKLLYLSRTIEKTTFCILGKETSYKNKEYLLTRENEKLNAIIDDLSYKYEQLNAEVKSLKKKSIIS